jgi:hypothetical protein
MASGDQRDGFHMAGGHQNYETMTANPCDEIETTRDQRNEPATKRNPRKMMKDEQNELVTTWSPHNILEMTGDQENEMVMRRDPHSVLETTGDRKNKAAMRKLKAGGY